MEIDGEHISRLVSRRAASLITLTGSENELFLSSKKIKNSGSKANKRGASRDMHAYISYLRMHTSD